MRNADPSQNLNTIFSIRVCMRKIVIYKGEDGYWIVEVPSLPGCITQGKTIEEALDNAREAIDSHIEALQKSKIAVPSDTSELVIAQV